MTKQFPALLMLGILLYFTACTRQAGPSSDGYAGTPFTDSLQAVSLQQIPGDLQCEFFDRGGEGVAYHDSDTQNNGSGNLNKGEGYFNTFRIDEAPDISYTKFFDGIDNSPYNCVETAENQLYLGWTEPGEWTRYTVQVSEAGAYRIGAMYTSNRGGSIQLFLDGQDSTGFLDIASTFDSLDPLDWRQWHHWNYDDSLGTMTLPAGQHVLTLKIEEEGNFNFDFLRFTRTD